jgi:hypothetical protein
MKEEDAAENSTNGPGYSERPQTESLLFFRISAGGGNVAGSDEEVRLNEFRQAGICPNCGKPIPEGTAVARGPGAFCSLECVALFHNAEFSERAKRLAAALHN